MDSLIGIIESQLVIEMNNWESVGIIERLLVTVVNIWCLLWDHTME